MYGVASYGWQPGLMGGRSTEIITRQWKYWVNWRPGKCLCRVLWFQMWSQPWSTREWAWGWANLPFLGGLSLHLNHLIGSRVTNYDWPFGTLLLGLFGSNLDTRDLETYPRTYSGHFWNMSLFDNSRAVWVLFRKWVVSENQSFLDEGAVVTPLIGLVLGEEVPRLNHGPIFFPIQNT